VNDVEALSLYGRVRAERHVQPTALTDHRVGHWSRRAAEPTNQRRRSVVAVVHLQPVVGAVEVCLKLEVRERLKRQVHILSDGAFRRNDV